MRSNGFTLVEILIAITILAFISIFTAQSIQRSIKFRAKIEQELDEYTSVRNALMILTSDINKAFHWVDINDEVRKQIVMDDQASGKPTPAPTAAPTDPNFIPVEKLTAFIGDKDSIYFTTLSHRRMFKDAQESDQAKIGYYLKDAKTLVDKKPTKALVRSESTVLDGDVKKVGKESILLENVESIHFRYLTHIDNNKEWLETWDSTQVSDSKWGNKFPEAVEITLVTNRGTKKNPPVSTVAAIHMPNNDVFKAKSTASPTPGAGH